ncbi:hypothetical protein [Luteolibacter luteus]|uniref:DUF3805 domain-containing protein n=1 Tax=Luteolibacter luteus TaxID=2728835 RepID=A0A858RLE5_9BACT|nr:hypothetical protein [Luteolibacter luteus]QJE96823.1 hypothetical protein HHL09_13865 [Luteolibacter luteus]
MNTFSIGNVEIDIAGYLDTRIEDGTLVAFFPESDFANARFTVVTVMRDGGEVPRAAEKIMEDRAAKIGAKLHIEENFVWYYTVEIASEGTSGSKMHYWFVGMGGHAVVVSCFIDAAQSDSIDARRVLDSILVSVKSIRRKSID